LILFNIGKKSAELEACSGNPVNFDRICHGPAVSSFHNLKGIAMRLHLLASLITILLLIIRFDAGRFDASAKDENNPGHGAYTENYLKFKNWLKLSDDQRKTVLTGYLRFIRNHGLKQLPVNDYETAKNILRNTDRDDLLGYVNQFCTRFENAPRVDGSVVEAIIFQYVRKRMETEKNFMDLLKVANTLGTPADSKDKAVTAPGKCDLFGESERYDNVFVSPYLWFYYKWWKRQGQNEKKALVSGYMVSLNDEIKRDWCYNEEERQRYDQFCKQVSVDDLVNHVDKLYENPLYRDDDASYMIYEYMIDNFQIFIGDPIAMQG